jgi:uncharacterized protein (TIRG00374 family)
MRIRTALVTLLAVGLFVWFLSRTDLSAVAAEVSRARLDLIAWAMMLTLVMPVVRAIRWRYLLDPVGPTRFVPVLKATVLGFAALALLPARAGDVIRPYMVARSEGLRVASVLATVVMERALDVIAVLALLAAHVWVFDGRRSIPDHLVRPLQVSGAVSGAAVVVLMAVMWTLATHPERIGRLVHGLGRFLPTRMAGNLGRLAQTFSEGFAIAREPRDMAIALAWSVPLWVSIALQAWLVTRAFGVMLPVSASFLVQAFLVLGVAVPTPGGVGSFHEAYRIAMTTFFHTPNDVAVSAALVLHAVSMLTSIVPGLGVMAWDGIGVGGLGRLAGAGDHERDEASR